jgi:hypothetical protein
MKSPVVKRSIVVAGHKTSVSLEEAFWNGMKEISGERSMTLSDLVGDCSASSSNPMMEGPAPIPKRSKSPRSTSTLSRGQSECA